MEIILDRHIRDGPGRWFKTITCELCIKMQITCGKSTDFALHQLVTRIEDSQEAKENTLRTFLEIDEAFKNTTVC